MTDRLDDIEIKLAHLEDAVNEMSSVMYRQQMVLDRLEQTSEQLRQRMMNLEPPAAGTPEDEKPPHY